ncbi:hypothetical protein BJF78_03440 [Pseudonocardia sp. CNS-139]|nr:hypothetical protein BJF78_03440 [Pseudonocardia sp. CNS-139]
MYCTSASSVPSNTSDVSEASPHCRLRGSCQSRWPVTNRRSVQIGSWCETHTASWPSASVRARCTAPSMRCAMSRYGSPHDGVNGSRRRCQYCGARSAPPPTDTVLPSNLLSASISPSSVPTSRPCSAATGAAVCWARMSGEARTTVTSLSASDLATTSAWLRPDADR